MNSSFSSKKMISASVSCCSHQVKVALAYVVDDAAGSADNYVDSSAHLADLRTKSSPSVNSERRQLRRDAVELTLHLFALLLWQGR